MSHHHSLEWNCSTRNTVEVWHERLGTKEMSVTVAEKATAEANFSLATQ